LQKEVILLALKFRKQFNSMGLQNRKILKTGLILFVSGLLLIAIIAGIVIMRTWGRTVIQVDIHQNKQLIYLSTFAEPPQFAIWLENPKTNELKTVFVTHRVAVGDWEGKANVPVALPEWYRLFRGNADTDRSVRSEKDPDMAISGATPKADLFSIRVEVKPGSEWICWIEMNLAGDFNDAFPEFDMETLREDEFSCGQPALLYKAEIRAEENLTFTPVLAAQSVWDKGVARTEAVSEGVTTAREVFDQIQISVSRPKPKLIDKNKIQDL
jgi:hypothetical protein